MNVPEMRLYYYYPSAAYVRHRKRQTDPRPNTAPRTWFILFRSASDASTGRLRSVIWRVTRKVKDPPWVLPEDIYQEHLERDGYAEHRIPAASPDNPQGHYKLDLSIPEYGLHGTDVPWGVGMTVSHGCVRLYPEDIERLFSKTPVGTPGRVRLSAGEIRLARRPRFTSRCMTTFTANIRGCGTSRRR